MDRGGTWSLDENKPRVDFRFPQQALSSRQTYEALLASESFPPWFLGLQNWAELVYMTCYRAIKEVKQKKWIGKDIFSLVYIIAFL